MAKYWEVIESTSGWNVYHIPEKGFSEQEARTLVKHGGAQGYLVEKEDTFWQIESAELKEEDD